MLQDTFFSWAPETAACLQPEMEALGSSANSGPWLDSCREPLHPEIWNGEHETATHVRNLRNGHARKK